MAASSRALFLSCFHGSGAEVSRHLALRPRYPSNPRRPRSAAVAGEGSSEGGGSGGDLEAAKGTADKDEEEKVSVFAVTGMTCAACAGSVEKAVKRLPGIHDAAVDVLGGRAQVVFYPAFVSVSIAPLLDFAVLPFGRRVTFFFSIYEMFPDDQINRFR
jgi:Cu+-exporting ATPase